MRLICPNCGAQYEVADNAIPAAGRDVQCSNCGHGWFQHRDEAPAVVAAPAPTPAAPPEPTPEPIAAPVAPEPQISEPEIVAPAMPEPVAVAEPAPEPVHPAPAEQVPTPVFAPYAEAPEPADVDDAAPVPAAAAAAAMVPAGAAAAAPTGRTLDENLLAVLREEAEREVAKRKAESARGIETQPDLGLSTASPPVAPVHVTAAPPRGRASDFSHLSSDADMVADTAEMPEASVRPAARRDLLPDVEVISSTLRSSRGAGDDDNPMPDLPPIRRQSGFRSGFLLAVLIAVFAVVAYALAPRLAEQFPAAKGTLDGYVAAVDSLRTWIGSVVASLNGKLES